MSDGWKIVLRQYRIEVRVLGVTIALPAAHDLWVLYNPAGPPNGRRLQRRRRRATLQAVGGNGQEGHNLATSPDGPAVWSPLVEAFLRTLR
jgi:hypothetical protein